MEAERKLAGAGVFKGHEGLRGLAESDSFWEKQPYGTRLYYGDGPFDYLQRGVLKTALKILDTPNARPHAEARSADSVQADVGATIGGEA